MYKKIQSPSGETISLNKLVDGEWITSEEDNSYESWCKTNTPEVIIAFDVPETTYEIRYYGPGDDDCELWRYITVWKKIDDADIMYRKFIDEGGKPLVVPYKEQSVSYDELVFRKTAEIQEAYKTTLECTPVSTIKGLTVKGGLYHKQMFDSGLYLFNHSSAPIDTITIFDYYGNPHDVTKEDIEQIILDIILDGNNNITKEAILLSQIRNLKEDTPDNRDSLSKIKW